MPDRTTHDEAVPFDDVLLTTKEAAAYLNTPPQTLTYWRGVNYGPLYHRTAGGRIRYRRGDILEYIYREGGRRSYGGKGTGARDYSLFRLADRSTR